MSRFIVPSAPRAALTCAVLVTVLTLAACGRDSVETPAATTPDTPAQTTADAPTATSPESTTPKGDAPEPEDIARDTASSDADALADAARLKKKDPDANPAPTSRTGKVKRALEKAGYDVSAFGATGEANTSLKIGSLMSVVFYRDEKSAKTDYANFKAAFASDGAHGAAIRRGRRVYLLATPNPPTAEQKRALRKVARLAEAAQR